jgi:hypothetical protein
MTLPYEARIHTSSSYLIEHSRDFHGWIEDGRALLEYDLEFICDTIDNAVDSSKPKLGPLSPDDPSPPPDLRH